MLGAADVRIIFITAERGIDTADDVPAVTLGAPELAVAAGQSDDSVRTIVAEDGARYRVATVHGRRAARRWCSRSRSTRRRRRCASSAPSCSSAVASACSPPPSRAGRSRPTACGPYAASRCPSRRTPPPRTSRPLPVEGDDEIARLTTAFNQMLGALSASRDRQRRLVADASHELRTPLTSLRTNLDLLAQADGSDHNDGGGLPETARRELLDDVRGQIEELTTLVGDLVDAGARGAARRRPSATLDLAEVADRAVTRVRRRAAGVDFDVRLEPWTAEGDATGLERAITNLLDNAAKWSPPGGTITVRLASGVLTVDDQGPGISEADLPHVFERFWRSEESRSMPGSGLGLAIVKQVVDQHGGRVVISDAPGGGTRMSLSIPGVTGR